VARLLAALPDLELSISATTRRPRPREDEGRHYYFVDRADFDRMIEAGGFLEWADIFGERYGTPREPVERALALLEEEAGRAFDSKVVEALCRMLR